MVLLLALACERAEPVRPDPWQLVGADGRAVLHRGVNVSGGAKWTEDHGHGLTEAELALLPAHGVTQARFLVFWDGIEPERGAYDRAYLDRIAADVAALEALGLEVVLDLHQDLYGVGFGSHGLPRWTCDEAAYAAYDPPEGNWFLGYADPALRGCFDAFWASPALQEDYADAVAELVARVPSAGVDVINEPFWGSYDRDTHDEVVLPAFYARVHEAVRAVDPDVRLWLAPSVAANLDADPALDLSGLDDPRLGVSPHFYPPYAELGTGWDGDLTDERAALDRLADHARDQGVPLWVGELGIFSEQGNEADWLRGVLGAIEGRGGSAAYWSFDRGSELLTEDGAPGPLLAVMAEPRVHRAPGRLITVDGAEVTLEGEGTVTWMAPFAEDCAVQGHVARRVGRAWEADVSGLVTVRLDCR